jgi:hypothetical protein
LTNPTSVRGQSKSCRASPRAISGSSPVDPNLAALCDDLARRLRFVRHIWRELKSSLPPGVGRRYFGLNAMAFTGALLAGGFWLMVMRQASPKGPEAGADIRSHN